MCLNSSWPCCYHSRQTNSRFVFLHEEDLCLCPIPWFSSEKRFGPLHMWRSNCKREPLLGLSWAPVYQKASSVGISRICQNFLARHERWRLQYATANGGFDVMILSYSSVGDIANASWLVWPWCRWHLALARFVSSGSDFQPRCQSSSSAFNQNNTLIHSEPLYNSGLQSLSDWNCLLTAEILAVNSVIKCWKMKRIQPDNSRYQPGPNGHLNNTQQGWEWSGSHA